MKRKKVLIVEALVISLLIISSVTALGLIQNNTTGKKEKNCSICPFKDKKAQNIDQNKLINLFSRKFTPSIGLVFLCGIFCFLFSYLPCMAVNEDYDVCGPEFAYCSLSCSGVYP